MKLSTFFNYKWALEVCEINKLDKHPYTYIYKILGLSFSFLTMIKNLSVSLAFQRVCSINHKLLNNVYMFKILENTTKSKLCTKV